jgi:hypothetical protein
VTRPPPFDFRSKPASGGVQDVFKLLKLAGHPGMGLDFGAIYGPEKGYVAFDLVRILDLSFGLPATSRRQSRYHPTEICESLFTRDL